MQLLTTADKIREFRDLSNNIRPNKINPHIMDAQMKDLRPLLGDGLFYAILNNPDVGNPGHEPKYKNLLEPKEYNTLEGEKSFMFGLERVICEFAYARYIFDSTDISTPNGLIQKQNENGQNTSTERAKELYTEQRKMGVTYWLSVERYLVNNRDIYPLFRSNLKEVTGNKTTYVKRGLWL